LFVVFSGIIRHMGLLTVLEKTLLEGSEGCTVKITSDLFTQSIHSGDSISVQGVCLTVTSIGNGDATFYLSGETLRRTSFLSVLLNEPCSLKVHLEPSLKLGDTIDGHFVYGHVDEVAHVASKKSEGETWKFEFETDISLYPYLASKGSVSLDGVSLTIGESFARNGKSVFTVYIIPHTYMETCFSLYESGSLVNLEIDPMARYAVHAVIVRRVL
jgi:riboflavin synthase